MSRTALSIATLVAAAGLARADVITQSFSYDWSTNDPAQHAFSFESFDTEGGTRKLIGVRLGFEGTISMEITAQTYDPFPIAAGEWSAEVSHTVAAFFHTGGVDLLQGIGGQWLADITGDLGAGTGGFPFGEPGTPYIVSDTVTFANVVNIDSSYFDDFSSGGPFEGFMDGFFDGVVTPPDNGQIIEILASYLSQTGTVTLTYEYAPVPAPAGLALVGVGALSLARRRRR